jgi:histidinol-phosphate aminotransferase
MTIAERPWLDRIQAYRPGQHATSPEGSMASNESPLGASPDVAAAIAGASAQVHHYPDSLAGELRAELAGLHCVSPDQVLVGNGSDELIFLLATAYLAHGGHAVCADPAYQIDRISTYAVNARLTQVPLRRWAHDLESMAGVDADIAYVVNPHNPTGTVRSLADIREFVAQSPAQLVVVDEAYIDFTEDPAMQSAMPLVEAGRVAVLRTFSKIHGLAGLRVGYLVAARDIIATLQKIRAPFSVGSLGQAAALATLRDPVHQRAVRDHTLRVRAELARFLEEARYTVIPSQANFVLVEVPDEKAFVARLLDHGVSVRPGSALGVPGTVRISVPSGRGLELLKHALSSTRSETTPPAAASALA